MNANALQLIALYHLSHSTSVDVRMMVLKPGVFLQTNKTYVYIQYYSTKWVLRSDKFVKFLLSHKTFANLIVSNILNTLLLTPMFTFSSLPLLAYLGKSRPPVDHWSTMKPWIHMHPRACAGNRQNSDQLKERQLHRACKGLKLQR